MMLIKWMSASSAADEWEVLSSHLQYLRCEISHITQWYLRATPFVGERAHLENTNGIPVAPCFSSLTLLYSSSLWSELKGSLLIKASVEVGSVTQLSYPRSSPGLPADKPLFSEPAPSLCSPRWSQTRCCGLGWHSARGPNLSRVQRNQKAPGCTQTWPRASHLVWVNNTSWMACLQSPQQGQKTSLNLSGWLSDVEQMCWNGGNYVTSFSPRSHMTMMTKEPWSGWCDYAEGDSHFGDSCAMPVFSSAAPRRHIATLHTCITMPSTGVFWWNSFFFSPD